MATPKTIQAVIGHVRTITGKPAWEVSLAPGNTTWLTVYADEIDGAAPCPGDVLAIVPPQAIGITRK